MRDEGGVNGDKYLRLIHTNSAGFKTDKALNLVLLFDRYRRKIVLKNLYRMAMWSDKPTDQSIYKYKI